MTETKTINIRAIEINPGKTLRSTITAIIHEIGVPAHVLGHRYLKDAIAAAVNDPTVLDKNITKRLYPHVASLNNTTPSRVERAIRHAIEVAWNRGDWDTLNNFFGNTIDIDKGKPTNSEFIALIADVISQSFQQ